MTTRKAITTDDAETLYEAEDDGSTAGPWIRVGGENEHYSRQSRWHDRYWLVVRDTDGATWGLEYGLGLTEDQENDLPWNETSAPELPLVQLFAHTVTKTEYHTSPPKAAQ